MRFGYFTLTDNPPAYGAARRDRNALLRRMRRQYALFGRIMEGRFATVA
jgi:hypothetical protein